MNKKGNQNRNKKKKERKRNKQLVNKNMNRYKTELNKPFETEFGIKKRIRQKQKYEKTKKNTKTNQ